MFSPAYDPRQPHDLQLQDETRSIRSKCRAGPGTSAVAGIGSSHNVRLPRAQSAVQGTAAARRGGCRPPAWRRPGSPQAAAPTTPAEDEDGWWLLHELRSRSGDIARLAQGQNGREIPAGALKHLEATWPDRFTRADFHTLTDPPHSMARFLVAEIATPHALRDALPRDISAKAGVLREPTPGPEERGAPAPRPAEVPAPRGGRTGHESGWSPENPRGRVHE